MEELATQAFWLGLAKIIGVNIILSGDNAVVIAMACMTLPPRRSAPPGASLRTAAGWACTCSAWRGVHGPQWVWRSSTSAPVKRAPWLRRCCSSGGV